MQGAHDAAHLVRYTDPANLGRDAVEGQRDGDHLSVAATSSIRSERSL
jgi:hypothetical protein